jgi:hypothetical protein
VVRAHVDFDVSLNLAALAAFAAWAVLCVPRMQLSLNPKTIRKGKPLGLPYQGSKKKIARQIWAH